MINLRPPHWRRSRTIENKVMRRAMSRCIVLRMSKSAWREKGDDDRGLRRCERFSARSMKYVFSSCCACHFVSARALQRDALHPGHRDRSIIKCFLVMFPIKTRMLRTKTLPRVTDASDTIQCHLHPRVYLTNSATISCSKALFSHTLVL